jgi:hypothetical protein
MAISVFLHLPDIRALPLVTIETLNPRGGDAIMHSKILHNTHEQKMKGGGGSLNSIDRLHNITFVTITELSAT